MGDGSDELKWLIAREIPHLRRYARALAQEVDEADDLVQATLERALRKRRQLRRAGSVRSWLLTALYRTHINRVRRMPPDTAARSAGNEAVFEALSTQARQERHIECRELGEALACLPEEQRAAVLLVSLEDVSYDEAAAILGIPIGTLRSRVSRARDVLSAAIGHVPETDRHLKRVK